MADIVFSTGNIPGEYKILGLVFGDGFARSRDHSGVGMRVEVAKAVDAVKEARTQAKVDAKNMGADAVVFCSVNVQKSMMGAVGDDMGRNSFPAFFAFFSGTAVKLTSS